jgi:non-heme chloroperoxidase
MSTVTTKDGVRIFYKDWGQGQPIVFHHGWPLSCDDWDTQMLFFVHHGYRVIGIDRRGHGRSSQVSDGHDMDHYAAELRSLDSCPNPTRRNGTFVRTGEGRVRDALAALLHSCS